MQSNAHNSIIPNSSKVEIAQMHISGMKELCMFTWQ